MPDVLDSLPAPLVVLDRTGTIVAANDAWERLVQSCDDPGTLASLGEGGNYLEAWRRAEADHCNPQALIHGITEVLAGRRDRFEWQFPALAAGRRRWLLAVVAPAPEADGLVVLHVDITAMKRGEHALRRRLRTLATQLIQTESRQRQRIAEELHGHLQQLLVAVRMQLERARMSPAQATRLIDEALQHIGEAVRFTRSLSHQLSPPVPTEAPLDEALAWLAEESSRRFGLPVTCQSDEHPKPMRPALRTLLFESVRELLLNVAKHAEATQATLEVERDDGWVHVTVADDGRGFAPEALDDAGRPAHGSGLWNVRQRLEALGGQMHIESVPHAGARVRLTAPVEDAEF